MKTVIEIVLPENVLLREIHKPIRFDKSGMSVSELQSRWLLSLDRQASLEELAQLELSFRK